MIVDDVAIIVASRGLNETISVENRTGMNLPSHSAYVQSFYFRLTVLLEIRAPKFFSDTTL